MGRSGFGTLRRGQVVGARYRIEDLLGRGGMSEVICATDLQQDRKVALKFPHTERARSPKDVTRLLREARVIAQLTSPFAARLFDTGTLVDDGLHVPYLVLEYVDGVDLATWLRAKGPVSATMAATIAWQVCDAIGEAHARGIVHRDIKPANLMLTASATGQLVTKVLDFGIARECHTHDPRLTNTADLVGSPTYMAPEQMRPGADVDARADVWALGVVLFEALVGRPPFESPSLPDLCLKILLDDPSPLPDSCPAELAAIVARCLAKEPGDRYASAREVADSLCDLAPRSLPISPTDLELAAMDAAASGHESSSAVVRVDAAPVRERGSRRVWRMAGAAAVLVLVLALMTGQGRSGSAAGARRGRVPSPPATAAPTATETRAMPPLAPSMAASPGLHTETTTATGSAPMHGSTDAATRRRANRASARGAVKRQDVPLATTAIASPSSPPKTTRKRDPLASPF